MSFNERHAEIKSNFLLIYVLLVAWCYPQKKGESEDSTIERSCRIIEDNEVYNEHDNTQSYRLLLIDKPVEGRFHPINSSQIGLGALHRKSIPGTNLIL